MSARPPAVDGLCRRRMDPLQVVLLALLVAVVSGAQLLGLRSVWALSATADGFDVAQEVIADVSAAQRDALLLRLVLDEDRIPVEETRSRTASLQQHLAVLQAQDLPPETGTSLAAAVASADRIGSGLDALADDTGVAGTVGQVGHAQLEQSAPTVRTDVGTVQDSLHSLAARTEEQYYESHVRTMATRRDEQALAMVAATVAVVLAGVLAVSLRRASRRDLERAVRHLVREQQDRSLAQEAAARTERRFAALVRQGDDVILVLTHGRSRSPAPPPPASSAWPTRPAGRGALRRPGRRRRADAGRAGAGAHRGVPGRTRPGRPAPAGATRVAGRTASPTWVSASLTDLGDDPAVGGIVVNAQDITDRVARASMLEHLAFHDRVTGLANRLAAERHLDGAGPDDRFSIVVLDLDGFGAVNDEAATTTPTRCCGPSRTPWTAQLPQRVRRPLRRRRVRGRGARLRRVAGRRGPTGRARPGHGVEVRVVGCVRGRHVGAVVHGRAARQRRAPPGRVGHARGQATRRWCRGRARREAAAAARASAPSWSTRCAAPWRPTSCACTTSPWSACARARSPGPRRWCVGSAATSWCHRATSSPWPRRPVSVVPLGSWVLAQACADLETMDAAGRRGCASTSTCHRGSSPRTASSSTWRPVLAERRTDPARVVVELTESAVVDDPDRVGGLLQDLRGAGHGPSPWTTSAPGTPR